MYLNFLPSERGRQMGTVGWEGEGRGGSRGYGGPRSLSTGESFEWEEGGR